MALEVMQVPVSDIDRAKAFYLGLGWRFDIDLVVGDHRTVQITPPHSQCSIQFGRGRTNAEPGSAQGMILVVSDIDAARADLVSRGVDVSEVQEARPPGFDVPEEERSYFARASFSDPDGNSWVLQEITPGSPAANGRTEMDVASLAELLHETADTSRLVRGGSPTARLVGLVRRVHGRPPERECSGRSVCRCRPLHGRGQGRSRVAGMTSLNGKGPETWAQSWTHVRVDRRTPSYCRVTFDHPPINTITATTVLELAELVGLIEQDSDLNVVVFDSANPDFYLAHYDVEHDPARTAALPAGPTGMNAWLDLLVRLSRAPVVSIASIRGRARGAGSEFVLACDLRFASRENTLLGQFEVGAGVVPGGGPMARLSRLVGRGRALEILLVADDLDGPRAEQYGYVNRAIADGRLDAEVDAIASRLARFDHDAMARTKSYVDRVTLPADSEFPPALADFFELLGRPAQRAQSARLEELGLNVDSDLERSLGARIVESIPDVRQEPTSP